MKIFKLGVLLCLLLSLTGCLALSSNGFYRPSDLVQDERLLGKWSQVVEQDNTAAAGEDGSQQIDLFFEETGGESGYDLQLTEGGTTNQFSASLFQLNGQFYLDLCPRLENLKEINSYFSSHLVKAHSLAKIELDAQNLKMVFLDSDSLKKIIIRKQLKGDYIVITENDDQIFLTGSVNANRKIIMNHSSDLFGSNPLEFRKKEL